MEEEYESLLYVENEEHISLLEEECAICYETMCNHDVLEPCGHHIHKTCFLMTRSDLCPMCRQVVKNPKPNVRSNNVMYLMYQHEQIPLGHFIGILVFMCYTYLILIIIKTA